MLLKNPFHSCIGKGMGGMLVAGLLGVAALAHAQDKAADVGGRKVLRVCQDPNNLPMSNEKQQGFENEIAALFAKKLGWGLEHTWSPQRMGFIRNTLRAKIPNTDTYRCDLVTSVSTDFDMGLVTKPYLSSTYALAYVKGKGLDSVKTPDDLLRLDPAVLSKLKIGVFGGSPPATWLLRSGLTEQMVSQQRQSGDVKKYPGLMIENDLVKGDIDVAIAWGPIVGYFAKNASVPIAVVPFEPQSKGVRYGFSIAMGVRYGEKEFRDQINQLIESSQPEIDAILTRYGVPFAAPVPEAKEDDD
jgi:quinoprotein dehydrogenase-associated probable ABC transporter substrate-binding protein